MNVELSSNGTAYIRYSMADSVDNVYVGGDDSSDVIVDIDAAGSVVGIELLNVSAEDDIASARAFAGDRGLPFPHDIAAAIHNLFVA